MKKHSASDVKKVLICTQYFWPEDFRINDLANEIAKSGFQVEVITGIPNYPKGIFFKGYSPFKPLVENYGLIKVYRLPIFPRGNSSISLFLNYLSFFFVSLASLPFLLSKKYVAVITFATSPAFAVSAGVALAKVKRIPSFTWLLDMWPESLKTTGIIKNPMLLKFLRPFFIGLYNQHTKILSQSHGFSRHLELHGIQKDKITYFPNWAEDIYKFIPREADPNHLTILFAGNIGEAQDLPTLLDAATNLKNYSALKWIILGDGRMKDWVKGQINARKLENVIELVDRRPQSEMPEWFSKVDLMYVSLKDDEIMSMTLPGRVQSYMACGKPILAVANGETANIVKSARCGFIVPAGSSSHLTDMIKDILQMPRKDLEQIGLNGLEYYQTNFLKQKRMEELILFLKNSI
jgi:colanic acid biosynthesis glycosyl transferase WcaI